MTGRARAALAISGLDPSGGAGIALDLRAFRAAGVWGSAACAALTVQSTRGVRRVVAVSSSLVREQAEEVLGDLDVGAIKTGALGSLANVRAVLAIAARHPNVPLVVDPVMIPSRGRGPSARLDGGAGPAALLRLAKAAVLVTPNLPEAAALLGRARVLDARAAAIELVRAGCSAALVKGGHGRGPQSVDWLATSGGVHEIALPRRGVAEVHGTGCALASLIAGRLARRTSRNPVQQAEIVQAARWARRTLDGALGRSLVVGGGLRVLDMPRGPGLR